jgi:GNAT superfamily N-acetyltransferase
MKLQIEPQHALSPNEIDAIEARLYEHNRHVTGRHDNQGLGFVIRDELGRLIGVAAGYTWAGTSELKQMWVDESHRGRGYARITECFRHGGMQSRCSSDLGGEL